MERKDSLIKQIREKRFREGKGVSEQPPEKGIKRFGFLLWNHVWKLIQLNVLFIVFSIPVVTIPAAFCGMNRALTVLIKDGNVFIWAEFIKEFKACLFKGIPIGLLIAFMGFGAYYCLSLSVSAQTGTGLVSGGLGIFLLILTVIFSSYSFVFLPTLALKIRHIIKNAFLFSFLEWKANGIILMSFIVAIGIIFMAFPISLLIAALGGVAFYQFVICFTVFEPLKRRIFDPYEKQKSRSS